MRARNRSLLTVGLASILLNGPIAVAQSSALRAGNECIPSSPFPCSTPEDEGLDPFVLEAFVNDATWWVESALQVLASGNIW